MGWYYYCLTILCDFKNESEGVVLMKPMAGLLAIFVTLMMASAQAVEPGADIFSAAAQGRLAEVRQLVLQGAPVDGVNAQGRTPVMGAAFYGNLQMVELLLAEGVDISRADNQGMTVLMLAAQSGNPELIRLLVANGADIAAKNSAGQSAEQVAKMRGQSTIVVLFEELKGVASEAAGKSDKKK